MMYYDSVSYPRVPGTTCRAYIAQIFGPHSRYRYQRKFNSFDNYDDYYVDFDHTNDTFNCYYNIDIDGVFELTFCLLDRNGTKLRQARRYILLCNGNVRLIDRHEHNVLTAVNFWKRNTAA